MKTISKRFSCQNREIESISNGNTKRKVKQNFAISPQRSVHLCANDFSSLSASSLSIGSQFWIETLLQSWKFTSDVCWDFYDLIRCARLTKYNLIQKKDNYTFIYSMGFIGWAISYKIKTKNGGMSLLYWKSVYVPIHTLLENSTFNYIT